MKGSVWIFELIDVRLGNQPEQAVCTNKKKDGQATMSERRTCQRKQQDEQEKVFGVRRRKSGLERSALTVVGGWRLGASLVSGANAANTNQLRLKVQRNSPC